MKKVEIEEIPNILADSGISPTVGVEVRKNQAGKDQLVLSGAQKTILIDPGSGLGQILEGDIDLLLKMAARTITIPGDLSTTQLLSRDDFRSSCVTEADLRNITNPLSLLRNRGGKVLAFYGSTSGINFAEVLETALCSKSLNQKVPSEVYFDTDSAPSAESQAIFVESLSVMPNLIREKVANYIDANQGILALARIQAAEELVGLVDDIPAVNFGDVSVPFLAIKDRFTLGQLILMAKAAGSNPKLFGTKSGAEVRVADLVHPNKRVLPESPFDLLSAPVYNQLKDMVPGGFTYYAREARMAQLYTFAAPLKMTDKANIYKILASMGSLYNPDTGLGMILVPISRMRILPRESLLSTRPIDPVVLRIMSLEDPVGFQRLVKAFKGEFKVLTPDEAIAAGTKDIRFVATDYMDIGEKDEI